MRDALDVMTFRTIADRNRYRFPSPRSRSDASIDETGRVESFIVQSISGGIADAAEPAVSRAVR
jgi:hypothetical protein